MEASLSRIILWNGLLSTYASPPPHFLGFLTTFGAFFGVLHISFGFIPMLISLSVVQPYKAFIRCSKVVERQSFDAININVRTSRMHFVRVRFQGKFIYIDFPVELDDITFFPSCLTVFRINELFHFVQTVFIPEFHADLAPSGSSVFSGCSVSYFLGKKSGSGRCCSKS